ncbi:hypothetical protein GCM10011273_06650 [Asticcacaulis endophyticus]|uniref:Uncharacterized protein n=1 Tax=Asticcacaulis endophyticus TaxID=1395890 RepID=A0A918UP63_9CAUL|nr:hypothetical protein GCM10011273_06650 [Asticcacaulis endophyticus]
MTPAVAIKALAAKLTGAEKHMLIPSVYSEKVTCFWLKVDQFPGAYGNFSDL